MIDFHCHLDLFPDPHALVEVCEQSAFFVLSVTTVPSAWRGTVALSAGSTRIRTALGLHPELAHEREGELGLFDALLPEAKYVGEVGLDRSPGTEARWPAQERVFRHILSSCQQAGGRIMSIHSRRAATEVLDALEAHPTAGVPILHWFSGSDLELRRAIALNCWFSVGPAMLRGKRGRTLAAKMPPDRILTESDGPFAQIESRAARPSDVVFALERLSDVWSTTPAAATSRVTSNFRALLASEHARQRLTMPVSHE
jgi:TatD DNase family protein